MTVVAASCSLAVRWRPLGSRCCSALERARERILRTPASLTGIVNGQSRRLGPLDALSPHHGGSKGVQRPFDAPPASCARLRPIHVTSTFRGEISHFTPPSALSAIPLTTSACPHPMAGQVLPQPPSEATWARARAVDAPVDFGSLRRVCQRIEVERRTPSSRRRRSARRRRPEWWRPCWACWPAWPGPRTDGVATPKRRAARFSIEMMCDVGVYIVHAKLALYVNMWSLWRVCVWKGYRTTYPFGTESWKTCSTTFETLGPCHLERDSHTAHRPWWTHAATAHARP